MNIEKVDQEAGLFYFGYLLSPNYALSHYGVVM